MNLFLRILAPYIAVLVGWVWLKNGWLAILLYHAQIILWVFLQKGSPQIRGTLRKSWFWILPAAFTGAGVYLILPLLIEVAELKEWLSTYQLTGVSLLVMIPYFGLLHPALEERHWRPITEEAPWAHLFFALYHAIVLASLLPVWLVVLSVLSLLGVSALWAEMSRREGTLLSPILFHILADLGLILAAWMLVR